MTLSGDTFGFKFNSLRGLSDNLAKSFAENIIAGNSDENLAFIIKQIDAGNLVFDNMIMEYVNDYLEEISDLMYNHVINVIPDELL